MDRLINNESVVICSVLSALVMDVNEISKLYLYAILTGDRAIRNRLTGYETYTELVNKESAYYHALNRKFVEFQPVFLNAMTMLELGGKIEKKGNQQYDLTSEGSTMALELQQEQGTADEVLKAAIHLKHLMGNKDAKQLYKDFKIVL